MSWISGGASPPAPCHHAPLVVTNKKSNKKNTSCRRFVSILRHRSIRIVEICVVLIFVLVFIRLNVNPPSTTTNDALLAAQKQQFGAPRAEDCNHTAEVLRSVNVAIRIIVSDEEHLRQHPHPYAGAKDELGHWGYIHDAKFLRRDPLLYPFTIPDDERQQICAPPGQGPEGLNSTEAFLRLTEHLQILPKPRQNGQSVHSNTLFCAVYTHPSGRNMTIAALETWGRRCDGFLAASTVTEAALGIVEIPHAGNNYGKYNGIWQKVRSMLAYIYQHYGSEYDYFHINGDDTYLVVENLKAFLHEKRPRYVGRWYAPWWLDLETEPFVGANWAKSQPDFYYPLGGPGYTLSAATLRFFVQEILPECEATSDECAEDYFVARCLWPAGIRAERHYDAAGADLYNPDGPMTFATFSNQSVSFHRISTPAYHRRMERLIYRRDRTDTDCPQA